jgi:flagella basal body P-ring formation protein FlgA
LRLPLCDQALAGYWSNGSRTLGHTTVGVRCDGSATWSLFVPVQISQQRPVAVLSRPINQGAALTPDSVTLVRRDVAPFTTGYFSTLQDIEGMIARRPLTAGTVLTPSLLDAPKLVRRGDQVRIEAANALINVQAMGTALRDGRSGERIPVKNLHSERVIEARVIAQGIVKIADRSVR